MSDESEEETGERAGDDGAGYEGPERRTVAPDRRVKPRGGRRATDALHKVADFVYRLLTEPPR